jgi:predicted permease
VAPALELPRIAQSLAAASARASASAGARRSLSLLVVAEIAAAIVVLCSGSLMLKAFQRVMSVDEGFQPENALTFSVDPPQAVNDPTNGRRRMQYAQGLLGRLRSAPGIEAAGMTDALPLGATRSLVSVTFPFQPEGAPPPDASQPQAMVTGTKVTPGYFRAMRVPLRQGRDIDSHDTWQTDAAMVNESLAQRYWPGESAVGKRFRSGSRWFTIVGVVADTRDDGPEQAARPRVFWPYPDVISYLNIVVRGRMSTAALVETARDAAHQADPNTGIFDVLMMTELLNRTLWTRRAYSWLFSAFAAIALLLAVTGIYGVVSYSVTRRTREIGIRMALGAEPGGVIAQVLRSGLVLAAAGAVIGLPAAWFAMRLVAGMLAGVDPHDPQAFAAVVVLLGGAVVAACFVPARRAARVDPLTALRFE